MIKWHQFLRMINTSWLWPSSIMCAALPHLQLPYTGCHHSHLTNFLIDEGLKNNTMMWHFTKPTNLLFHKSKQRLPRKGKQIYHRSMSRRHRPWDPWWATCTQPSFPTMLPCAAVLDPCTTRPWSPSSPPPRSSPPSSAVSPALHFTNNQIPITFTRCTISTRIEQPRGCYGVAIGECLLFSWGTSPS